MMTLHSRTAAQCVALKRCYAVIKFQTHQKRMEWVGKLNSKRRPQRLRSIE